MKIHPLRKLDSCIYFFRECSLVKLGLYIILAMLLVKTCKKPHFKILHRCLGVCQLRKNMKYEILGNFPLTWSLKFGWLFQVIWCFNMIFLKPCTPGPNSRSLQGDLNSFTNSGTWHVLGLFKMSGKPFDIFGWGLLSPVASSHEQIWPWPWVAGQAVEFMVHFIWDWVL